MAAVGVQQQQHPAVPAVPADVTQKRLEVSAPLPLMDQQQAPPHPQVHRAEQHALRVAAPKFHHHT